MSDLVTVFQTGDPVALALVKATLESEGMDYVAQGEGVQDFIGLGRVPSGYNAVTGPVRIQVAPENAERARELLKGIER
jgi:hypothetical protein